MTDITERLRLRTDPSQMLMCYPPRPAPDMLCYAAADEIERLRAALQEIIYLFLDAVQSDCENGVRSLNEKAYAKYLSDYPATLAAIHSMNGIIDAALAGEASNDAAT